MSLSKASRKHTISKGSGTAVHVAGVLTAGTGGDFYGVAANIPCNKKLRNPAAQARPFTETNLVVLTVNPKLDKAASAEKLNAKAESAKKMFAAYRDKK